MSYTPTVLLSSLQLVGKAWLKAPPGCVQILVQDQASHCVFLARWQTTPAPELIVKPWQPVLQVTESYDRLEWSMHEHWDPILLMPGLYRPVVLPKTLSAGVDALEHAFEQAFNPASRAQLTRGLHALRWFAVDRGVAPSSSLFLANSALWTGPNPETDSVVIALPTPLPELGLAHGVDQVHHTLRCDLTMHGSSTPTPMSVPKTRARVVHWSAACIEVPPLHGSGHRLLAQRHQADLALLQRLLAPPI